MLQNRHKLIRISLVTFFLCLILGCAVRAESVVDVNRLTQSLTVTGVMRNVVTNDERVIVELPMSDGRKSLTMQLDAEPAALPYRWQILTLVNNGTERKKLVLSLDHQKFAGSRIVEPRTPGSIIASIGVNAGTVVDILNATGEDNFELTMEPQAVVALAFQLRSEMTSAILWNKPAFEAEKARDTFLRGAILGIALLLFAAMLSLSSTRRRNLLPIMAGGALVTSALGFIALEEGYQDSISRVLGSMPLSAAEARGLVEMTMAVSLTFCLAALLDSRRRNRQLWSTFIAVLVVGTALAVWSFVNPYLVATLARLSFAVVAVVGFIFLYRKSQAVNRQAKHKHAVHEPVGLLPWSILLAWTGFAAILAVTDGTPTLMSYVLMVGLLIFLVLLCYRLSVESDLRHHHAPTARVEPDRRALALSAAQQYVWDWRPHDHHLFVSEELDKILGYPVGHFHLPPAEYFLEIMHPADRNPYLAALENARRRGRGSLTRDMRLQRADGSYRWFELKARVMPQQEHRPLRMIGALADVTNVRMTQERLIDNAIYDRVTGLPNRALFMDRLEREINRHGVDSLYVMLIDLDRFKSLNDGLGDETGDALLAVIGRRLQELMSPGDTLARLPGDQFAILLSHPEQRGLIIEAIAAEVLAKIASPIIISHHEVFLTACIGIAAYRYLGMKAVSVMKEAAVALYEAKRLGKENIVIFDASMQDTRGELVVLENELRRALERSEIEVQYQPIARLADMELAGFEALVRWRHPVLGLLQPDSFLDLAEQTGLINDIGQYVLNEALRQLGIWQRSFRPHDPIFMAVNLSASQLLDTDIVSDISTALVREAVYRQSVKIEVTESVVMQFPEKAAALLQRIKQLGVGLACDDFGTGYSSLSSLRDLPFDTLKIDRSFIEPEAEGERAQIILSSIITMAHQLGMAIVVEGIESQPQVDRLGAMGVDLGQGYFIGQPLTTRQISEALIASSYQTAAGPGTIANLWERTVHDPFLPPQDIPLSSAALKNALPPSFEEIVKRASPLHAPPSAEMEGVREPNLSELDEISLFTAAADLGAGEIEDVTIVTIIMEGDESNVRAELIEEIISTGEPEELPPIFPLSPADEESKSSNAENHPPTNKID